MLKLAVFAGLLLFAGCSSSSVTSEPLEDHSLNAVIGAVERSLSMGIQGRSENGREFYSRPFLVAQDDSVRAQGYRDRGVAKVTVLGDMRPYTVDAEVKIERGKVTKDPRDIVYVFHHYDQRLAKKLLNSILETLTKGDRNKNVIDDFRPF